MNTQDKISCRLIKKAFTTTSDLRRIATTLNIPLTAILHKDQLKQLKPKAGQSFIINMEDSNGPQGGTHWISFVIMKNDHPIYFDSYGAPPPCDIIDFCKKYTDKPLLYSDKQIQSIRSGSCGQYCILFLNTILKTNGNSRKKLKTMVNIFK
jgi:hypothetical protein